VFSCDLSTCFTWMRIKDATGLFWRSSCRLEVLDGQTMMTGGCRKATAIHFVCLCIWRDKSRDLVRRRGQRETRRCREVHLLNYVVTPSTTNCWRRVAGKQQIFVEKVQCGRPKQEAQLSPRDQCDALYPLNVGLLYE